MHLYNCVYRSTLRSKRMARYLRGVSTEGCRTCLSIPCSGNHVKKPHQQEVAQLGRAAGLEPVGRRFESFLPETDEPTRPHSLTVRTSGFQSETMVRFHLGSCGISILVMQMIVDHQNRVQSPMSPMEVWMSGLSHLFAKETDITVP